MAGARVSTGRPRSDGCDPPFYEENEIIRSEMTKDHAGSCVAISKYYPRLGLITHSFEANNFLRFPVNGQYVRERGAEESRSSCRRPKLILSVRRGYYLNCNHPHFLFTRRHDVHDSRVRSKSRWRTRAYALSGDSSSSFDGISIPYYAHHLSLILAKMRFPQESNLQPHIHQLTKHSFSWVQ